MTSRDFSGSRDVIGHVTINPQPISYWWYFGNQASISNGFRDIQCRM